MNYLPVCVCVCVLYVCVCDCLCTRVIYSFKHQHFLQFSAATLFSHLIQQQNVRNSGFIILG